MGRRKSGDWWLGVLLAAGIYMALHAAAQIEPPRPGSVKALADSINTIVMRALATFLQYLFPAAFLTGAGVSAYHKRRRSRLLDGVVRRADASALLQMSWRDFERLVGEMFRRRGYSSRRVLNATRRWRGGWRGGERMPVGRSGVQQISGLPLDSGGVGVSATNGQAAVPAVGLSI